MAAWCLCHLSWKLAADPRERVEFDRGIAARTVLGSAGPRGPSQEQLRIINVKCSDPSLACDRHSVCTRVPAGCLWRAAALCINKRHLGHAAWPSLSRRLQKNFRCDTTIPDRFLPNPTTILSLLHTVLVFSARFPHLKFQPPAHIGGQSALIHAHGPEWHDEA